jgi:hypothetical protein
MRVRKRHAVEPLTMPTDRRKEPAEITHPTEFDELFGRAYPNPDRVGCPSRADLIALARRQRPIGDPAYDHIKECSPCYLEGRAIQEADARRRRILTWAAAAVLVIAAGTGGWMLTHGRSPVDTEIHAQLDLRPFAITRGESQTTDRSPLQLPRGRVLLTLLLPTGSEPGPYDVEVRDSNAVSKAAARGEARLRRQVTVVTVALATGSLTPGTYLLAVRRARDRWQEFPMRVE